MELSLWLSFLSVSAVLAVAPGPDNLFVLAQSTLFGARAGLLVVAGLCTGLLCQTLLAVFGISVLITAQPGLMLGIRIAGACYLAYLAWGAWQSARSAGESGPSAPVTALSPVKLWLRGWLMNMTNPKVLIFFLAFFPQFIPEGLSGRPLVIQMAVQGATFLVTTVVVFSAIAFCSGSLADRMRSPRFQRIFGIVSALIFLALAVLTLLSA